MLFKSRKNKYIMDTEVLSHDAAEPGVTLIMPDSKKNKKEESEEWVWVSGYKGTKSDMSCLDYQYELNKQFDMPEGSKIEECQSGFHLCLNLNDVFSYYAIRDGHRFFKVSALVRKKDLSCYGKKPKCPDWCTDEYTRYRWNLTSDPIDKLTAKSIIFLQELTPEEIFEAVGGCDFTLDEMKQALEVGIKSVVHIKKVNELMSFGLCEPVAIHLARSSRYDFARDILQQKDMSLDAKMMIIFECK